MTDEADRITVAIPNGGAYTFGTDVDRDYLAKLAPAILSHLGASFEIRWPDHEAGWGGRDHVMAKRNDQADEYAAKRADDGLDRERLRNAWIAGWQAAPKPVTYPVR